MPSYRLRHLDNGHVEFQEDASEPWEPTVRHATLRERFISQTSHQGAFTFGREHGLHPLDVTSYHPDLDYRSPNRADLPPILHIFSPDWQPLPPWFPLPVQSVGYMRDEGRVVLDFEDKPIKAYPEIPLTCSSEMSGRDMELISRRNKYISPADFRARMMPTRQLNNNEKKPQYVYNTFSMRMTRFRLKHGLISWLKRDGSNLINKFMGDRLSPQCRAANSTLHGSDLDKVELKKLELLERGEKFLNRAGARAITETERKARTEKMAQQLAKLEELTAQQDVSSTVVSGDLDEEPSVGQQSPGKKRGMVSAGFDDEESAHLASDNGVNAQTTTRPNRRNKAQGSIETGVGPSTHSANTMSLIPDQTSPKTLSENHPERDLAVHNEIYRPYTPPVFRNYLELAEPINNFQHATRTLPSEATSNWTKMHNQVGSSESNSYDHPSDVNVNGCHTELRETSSADGALTQDFEAILDPELRQYSRTFSS